MRRLALPIATTLCALVAAGCGHDRPVRPPKPVHLTLRAPGDGSTVDAQRATVSGSVTPASAEVWVRGRRVDVAGGAFSTEVDLDEGANLVDVSAAAPGRRPVSTAVRVVREVPIEVPALAGEPADTATAELEVLHLKVTRRKGGGLLDGLLPGEPTVCTIDPAPGTRVKPGSEVVIETARSC